MLKITKNQGSIQVTADKSGFYPFDGTITFPTNSLFTATSANTDMITFKSTSNGDVQFVGNYKDITISGRSYDTKQKFLTAFSNLANQGSVDAYTKAETDAKIDAKQNKLKAGNGITLTEDATDGTTVVKTAVSLTDNGNGAYTVGDSIGIGDRASVRIGNNNNVLQGQNSIVIGDHAMTNAEKCIAIGNSSEVDLNSTCSIVIGDSARAYSKNSVAIGYSSNATKDNPLVINAGYKTVDNNTQPLTVLQSDSTGKLSILKGDGTDERMVIQDEIEALKNAGGSGGTVDAYTKAETDTKLETKQDKLTAGSGITITKDETAGTSTIATAVSLTDEGNGAYQVGSSIKMGSDTVTIGRSAASRSEWSIAIGKGATSGSGTTNVAIGNIANSSGGSSIAIGDKTETSNFSAIAIGTSTGAYLPYSIAIGHNAKAVTNKPLVINAGNKTVLQSDSNGKLSILKGDGTDERIVIQDALSAGGSGGGTVDAYTKTETDNLLNAKQNTLTAGTGITIDENNVISSTGGSGGTVDGLVINEYKVAAGLYQTSYTNRGSVVIGNDVEAYNDYSVLIGQGVKGRCDDAVVIGRRAETTTNSAVGSVVIGNDAKSSAHYGVSIGTYAEADKTTPLVINAGVNDNSILLTMIQGDTNGKISLLKGDGTDTRMVIQDEIAALKAEIAALKAEIAALKGGASTGDTTGDTTGA